ncbi:hypothetical protein [Roseivivax sp. THAF197b]|uniref:hypothetical protein n=1 Tax=Roseivivax sp. THAF197b TaxID=2588299 RepID=UPI0012683881|nr:hypothetical protein [Roseivivax sp. THAF197b]QFS84006.1 hypothetical protein FIV09_14310 [Roseivivax sp. THAF197b]
MTNLKHIEACRRAVTEPALVRVHPALMADAFLTLAEARGMTTRFENLGPACHRIGPATGQIEAPIALDVPQAEKTEVEARLARIPALVRAHLERSGRTGGGDAA